MEKISFHPGVQVEVAKNVFVESEALAQGKAVLLQEIVVCTGIVTVYQF